MKSKTEKCKLKSLRPKGRISLLWIYVFGSSGEAELNPPFKGQRGRSLSNIPSRRFLSFFFPAFPSRVQAAQFLTFSCQRESIVDGMRPVTSALVLQRQWWQSGSLRHNGGNQRRVVFNPKERKKTFINQQSLNLMAKIERFSVCAWVQVPNPSLGEPSGCLKSNLHSR